MIEERSIYDVAGCPECGSQEHKSTWEHWKLAHDTLASKLGKVEDLLDEVRAACEEDGWQFMGLGFRAKLEALSDE